MPERARIAEEPDECRVELEPVAQRRAELGANADFFQVEVVVDLRSEMHPVGLPLGHRRQGRQHCQCDYCSAQSCPHMPSSQKGMFLTEYKSSPCVRVTKVRPPGAQDGLGRGWA